MPHGLEVQTTTGAVVPVGKTFEFHSPGKPPVPIPAGVERPSRIDRLVAAIRGELTAEELAEDREAVADVVHWMAEAYACVV